MQAPVVRPLVGAHSQNWVHFIHEAMAKPLEGIQCRGIEVIIQSPKF